MNKKIVLLIGFILLFLLIKPPKSYEVRFTSYYPNDSTNSSTCTASLLCIEDFKTNDKGMYTYKGKVVLATATYECTALKEGTCGKYNELPKGFHQHHVYDTMIVKIDGINYEGIVLDICGASYWDEDLQRYDVFVENDESSFDVNGNVITELGFNTILFIIYIVIVLLYIIYRFIKKRGGVMKKTNINISGEDDDMLKNDQYEDDMTNYDSDDNKNDENQN